MLEFLTFPGTAKGGADVADRRWVQARHRWRLRLYTALAARYRMSQPMMQTMRRLANRKMAVAPKSREAAILDKWVDQMVNEGDTIDIVLKGWVPAEEILIIAASPNDKGLDRAAALLEKTLARRGMVRTALFYPVLLVVMLIAMLWIVGTFVMPNVLAMQARQGVAPSMLFTILAAHAWLAPLPFAVLFLGVRWSLPLWSGQARIWFDLHLWPWTHYRRVQASAFLVSYAAMWGGGLTELETLYAIAETSSPWLKERVLSIARWVEDGRSLGEAMQSSGYGFPDPQTIEDIGDIETVPDEMAKHLEAMAERDSKALQQQFDSLATVLGLLIMITVGAMLLGIVASIVSAFNLSAMMDLMQNQGAGAR